MTELTFNVGESRKRITKRKLSNPEDFNKIMNEVKVPSEFSRRGRSMDFKVMKGEEFRNIVIYFFPIIVSCILGTTNDIIRERRIWLTFSYLIRAYVLPQNEYINVSQRVLQQCIQQFMKLFEDVYGSSNCSYNIHMMCHLQQVRRRGPLTETSTFKTESYYSEMRRSYQAGTMSTGKQILQNAFI